MQDSLYSGRIENLQVAVAYALTTGLTNQAVLTHDCDPYAAHILGRALNAAVLGTAALDPRDRMNICWKYHGHLRTVLVDAGADGTVRGLISPPHLSPLLAQSQDLFGEEGVVQVVRSRDGHILSSGTVESILQDVVADLSFFYACSDQVETAMSVLIGFNHDSSDPVRVCRGLMLQAMPDTDLSAFEALRNALDQQDVRALLAAEREEPDHLDRVLNALGQAAGLAAAVADKRTSSPVFRCTCNREKMAAVVRALPYGDRAELVRKREEVAVRCHFCGERYTLTINQCINAWNHRPLDAETDPELRV